jgi:hypothetical protein
MATLPPLEYDISGLDQYKQGARTGVRGAQAAGAAAEEIFRQNAQRRAAWKAANGVTPEMLEKAQRFGGPSTPVGDNPAPSATARAAAAPSFGARVLQGARTLGRASLPVAAGMFAYDAAKLLTPEKVAVGMADAVGTLGQKLGIESLGQYAGGSAQVAQAATIPDPQRAPAAAAPGAPQVGSTEAPESRYDSMTDEQILASTPPAVADAAFARRQQVALMNQLNTALTAQAETMSAPAAPMRTRARQPMPVPQLGTQGGIFSNLAQFTNDFGTFAIEEARTSRGIKAQAKAAETEARLYDSDRNYEVGMTNAQTNRQNAKSKGLEAVAEILKQQTAAGKENKKVVQDITGTPVIVDLRNNTARKVTPTEVPTFQRWVEEARKDSRNKRATDAQLKAFYDRTYAGER